MISVITHLQKTTNNSIHLDPKNWRTNVQIKYSNAKSNLTNYLSVIDNGNNIKWKNMHCSDNNAVHLAILKLLFPGTIKNNGVPFL